MADIKITLKSFGKDVLVSSPAGVDLQEAFNEASQFVESLEAANKIRDTEQGIDPPKATHEIVRDGNGDYRLKRFRFGAA